jgi:hypothetical protein
VRDVARWLDRLLALLSNLGYVLTMGKPARDGWLQLRERSAAARDLVWQPVPHPSPQNLNTRAGAKDEILAGLGLAAGSVADGELPGRRARAQALQVRAQSAGPQLRAIDVHHLPHATVQVKSRFHR